MKTTFTRKQRVIITLYTACLACLLAVLLLSGTYIAIAFVSGWIAGYNLLYRFIETDQFRPWRALAGGCLTTFFATYIVTVILNTRISNFANSFVFDLEPLLNENGISAATVDIIFTIMIFMATLFSSLFQAFFFTIILSLIGGPAATLLAYLIYRHQQKYPALDKAAFE